MKNIPKLNKIKLRILFTSISKINYITSFLVFSILTQTKPFLKKGLKNYKENKVDLEGLDFIINKHKYDFLSEFNSFYILDNKECFIRLKKQPKFISVLNFNKYLENTYFDKIYELASIVRNTQQIKFRIFFEYNSMNANYNNFFFNLMIHHNVLPKILQ